MARSAPRPPRPPLWVTVAALAAVALAGCGRTVGGTGDVTSERRTADLAGAWHLVAGRDAAGHLTLRTQEVTLMVDGNEAGGTSGCNHYFATVHTDRDSVRFRDVGGTEMGCEPRRMELERRYTSALTSVESAERTDGRLVLSGPDVVLTFASEPSTPDVPLVGTTWVLESLAARDTVASPAAGGRLRLRGDGRFVAVTGCGEIHGKFRLAGGALSLTGVDGEPGTGRRCGPAAWAVYDHMADVLRGDVVVRVDGSRLSVRSPSTDRGLELRAG